MGILEEKEKVGKGGKKEKIKMKQKVFSKTKTKHAFKISCWNAGGFTHDKFTELKHTILNQDFDVMGIVECGTATDKEDYLNIPGYQRFLLKRSRQIASGIFVS